MAEHRTWSAVVVDDEPAAREAVIALLADEPRIEVVGQASNGRDAESVVRDAAPDLLLLDIQMPDRDGFGVLDALGADVPRVVVFVTAHDEHALRAFEVHALDYVVKPFGRPRFHAAIERAIRRLEAEDAHSLSRTLASMIASMRAAGEAAAPDPGDAVGNSQPARFAVRRGDRTALVPVRDVDWVEAEGDYARLHAGTSSHLIAARMHRLETRLEAAGFMRIHRSTIVNLARVAELERMADGGGIVVLSDGVQLRVARNRRADLESALGL